MRMMTIIDARAVVYIILDLSSIQNGKKFGFKVKKIKLKKENLKFFNHHIYS